MEYTKLIETKDGALIEVAASTDEVQQISSKTADKVGKGLDQIKPLFQKAIDAVVQNVDWKHDHLAMEQVEIELGLGFEAEGNVYVVKGKGTANFNVKFTIKPK